MPKNPISEFCCTEAPPVVEFDPEGNVVGHWGGPGAGFEWMPSMHGITVDAKDNVWFAGNGGNTVSKFSRDGKFLLQVGKNGASKGNTDTANFANPAEVSVDDAANEVYVADGYGNRRVIVIDATSGKFKRMWGAYGKPPVDRKPNVPYDFAKPSPLQLLRTLCTARHWPMTASSMCAIAITTGSRCFRKDGTYVKETQIAKRTLGAGVTFDIGLSRDKAQRLVYVADGANNRVWQLLREPMQVLNHIGDGGRYPASSTARTMCRSTPRETSTPSRPTAARACRSSPTRVRPRWRSRRVRTTNSGFSSARLVFRGV